MRGLPVFRPEKGEWIGQWGDITITVADPALSQAHAPELRESASDLLKRVLPGFHERVFPRAIDAASEGCRKVLGWQGAPELEDWETIALEVDARDRLWVAVQEYVADDYALWIVGFDCDGQARHLRRAPDLAGSGQAPLHLRGDHVLDIGAG